MQEGAEGSLPPVSEQGQSTVSTKTPDITPALPPVVAPETKGGLLGLLRRLIKRKPAEQPVEAGNDPTTQIEQIRDEVLEVIAQRRSVSKLSDRAHDPEDNKAEEAALNKIRELGGQLTDEEFHRLAQIVAVKRLSPGASLTEEMVEGIEKELRSGPQEFQRAA